MKKKIEKTFSHFQEIKRGKSIIVLENNAPDELLMSIRKANNNHLSSDFSWEKYRDILTHMLNYDIENLKELEENKDEIIDSLVDVDISNLTAWLNEQPVNNVSYIEKALEEFGPTKNGQKLLVRAQWLAIEKIYLEVVNYLLKL